MHNFFKNFNFSLIDLETATDLDKPITLEEITIAINSMNSGKTPGPDGFGIEFYKAFSNKLAPLLLNMYTESFRHGSLLPSLTQATISLILKKDKDPTLCTSYRPISLLCNEHKILAKVLAKRMETVLPLIISEDQMGFVKGRHSFSNIRRLLNIVLTSNISHVPEAVLSMDAEKAFDRIEWDYLFSVLVKFGFGDTMVSWIKLLYTSPQVCVRSNSLLSSHFPLSRGTRQGCPLSPLLFALVIEPLSIALNSTPDLKGIVRFVVEHRVSLYADDLLLYLSHPASSAHKVVSILEEFGSFSGYKLNFQKSEFFPINDPASQINQSDIPFHLNLSSIKYLGISVTRSLSSMYDTNLMPVVTDMKANFQRWGNLPLSLPGRVQCVKMNVLPKFLYIFQCLPVFIPKSFFQKIDSAISSFIWAGKN